MLYGLPNEELSAPEKYQKILALYETMGAWFKDEKDFKAFLERSNFQVFLQSEGSPLELLMFTLIPTISGFITGFETDYPLQLANNGICLNLDHVFDESNEIG